MLGLFGMFGRAWDLRELERAMRAVDLHPRLVTDAVKIAAVRLLREHGGAKGPSIADIRRTAALIAYCMIGAESFAGANSVELTHAVEERIGDAMHAGDSLDARIVLLTLHAGIIQPSVVAHFGLESRPV